MTAPVINWIEEHWNIPGSLQEKIFYSLLAIFILSLFRFLANKLIYRTFTDVKVRYMWKSWVKNTIYFLLLIIIMTIWLEGIESLATFLGLVSAGLAIALQSPIVNLAGWLFIIIRKPFEVGDRVQVGNHAGDVIDIRFFQFTINEIGNWVGADQSTGRIIHIPNGQVFNISQANYNQGFSHIWNEITVLVTFESNWKKARKILEEIINRHADQLSETAEQRLLEASKKFMIFYSNLTPFVYIKAEDSGVLLTIRYLTLPKTRRITEHRIWENILEEFAKEEDIDFAYPTQRIYYNPSEGKGGTIKNPLKH
ncbi:mechanosensitive ion channel family protein [Fulvivirga sedimenti]|uniref:Mechanosensitive ion channel family protein n=1 Tax=Fulvivirga sedimenti TaxID=2879465 RepID=A0A9X1HR80_9BACT|nr:mechanosensitive ion channel family protein [Fulvivirga sedimenti]MCA6074519.1 mechanosensitive ion channel family protein [Fulvivirga sedimenti]MCA6075696.1 mechanosensitive ion channel family protein [Fulvivirga sedimenti]MCA6076824.1 mechanosensitive ion channel family protein [Fulvivirga sedimenti]